MRRDYTQSQKVYNKSDTIVYQTTLPFFIG